MIFSKRYKELLYNDQGEIDYGFIDNIDFSVGEEIVSILKSFNEPKTFRKSRYNKETVEIDAFTYALFSLNQELGYQLFNLEMPFACYGYNPNEAQLAGNAVFLFDVIELQYDVLSAKEKRAFAKELNTLLNEREISWLLIDGKMVKIDAKQFEIDVKQKALAKIKELSDCDSKFKPAFAELQKAIEFYSKGEYSESVTNANKCYESILKVILGVDKGNAKDLVTKVKDKLDLPQTLKPDGFKDNVLMSLPYIRNNASSHGAGSGPVIISKTLANLSINLSAVLCTYLIEENSQDKGT